MTTAMPAPPMVRLLISDVPIIVVFSNTSVDEARRLASEQGLSGEVVPVWLDDAGRMQFLAPREQRRFFQSLNYDQLRALATT